MNDYRLILKKWLDEKKAKNPRFSLRAFAEKVELSHSALSQVFKGKRNLSPLAAQRIVKALRITGTARTLFLLSVQLVHALNQTEREEILKEIALISQFAEPLALSKEEEDVFDWVGGALYSMKSLPWASLEPRELARLMDVSVDQVKATLVKLEELGLLKRDSTGRLIFRGRRQITHKSEEEQSRLEGIYFRNTLKALQTDNPSRAISWVETFPMNLSLMNEAMEITTEYMRKMTQLRDKMKQESIPAEEVYQLSVAFHNMIPGRWKKD